MTKRMLGIAILSIFRCSVKYSSDARARALVPPFVEDRGGYAKADHAGLQALIRSLISSATS